MDKPWWVDGEKTSARGVRESSRMSSNFILSLSLIPWRRQIWEIKNPSIIPYNLSSAILFKAIPISISYCKKVVMCECFQRKRTSHFLAALNERLLFVSLRSMYFISCLKSVPKKSLNTHRKCNSSGQLSFGANELSFLCN